VCKLSWIGCGPAKGRMVAMEESYDYGGRFQGHGRSICGEAVMSEGSGILGDGRREGMMRAKSCRGVHCERGTLSGTEGILGRKRM